MAGSSDDAHTGEHEIDDPYSVDGQALAALLPEITLLRKRYSAACALWISMGSAGDDLVGELSRLRTEIVRLRAELDRHREAGDEQFRRVEQVSEQINAQHEFLSEILDDAVHAWRSVRGDEPAVGGDSG